MHGAILGLGTVLQSFVVLVQANTVTVTVARILEKLRS